LLNLSTLFLAPLLLQDNDSRDKLIVALLLGTLAMLALSMVYFLRDRDANFFIPVLEKLHYAHPEAVRDIFSANYKRLASPWVHPNLTGGILVLIMPLAFFYALSQAGWRRLLGAAVALLGAAGLLFSISRGAIVSLFLVMLWLGSRRVPQVGRILMVTLALGVALVLFYPPLQERLSTIFSSSNASTTVRFDEYRHFPEAMRRFPLGIGFKVDPPPPDTGLIGISNLWLNYIYKIGLPGMLLFVAVTLAWWRETRPRGYLDKLGPEQALWLGSWSGLVAALQFCQDKTTRQRFSDETDISWRCRSIGFDEGVIIRSTLGRMIMAPALVISRGEIDELIDKTRIAVDRTAEELGAR
jgi:hypothetical protein